MTQCRAVKEWLPWYISGLLSLGDMQQTAEHITQRDVCQQALTQIIQLRDPASPIVFRASSISPRMAGSSMVAGTL